MTVLVDSLAAISFVLAAFFVFLPRKRENFAEVLSVSVLALVLCGGFKALSSAPEATDNVPAKTALALAGK